MLSGTSQTEEYSQYKNTMNKQYSFRSNLSYTEKLTDHMQLQLGYKFSYSEFGFRQKNLYEIVCNGSL